MQSNTFIWAVVVLVLIGGGLFYWYGGVAPSIDDGASSSATQSETDDEGGDDEPGAGEDEFDALISYTTNGFEPASVTVKKGDTVRFVNNATSDTWPASARHPTHTVYPGSDIQKCGTGSQATIFDACRGLKPGEFWEFTFNDTGEWAYHNHMDSSKFGKVIVTE